MPSQLPNFTDPGLLPGTPFQDPKPGHGHFASKSASITTGETTTSTTHTDLATVGPTVTLGVQGLALVIITVQTRNDTAGAACGIAIDMNGANTQSVSDAVSVVQRAYSANLSQQHSACFVYSDLNYGTTTWTLKYRVTTGTGTFENRRLSVIPIPTHTHPTGAAPGGGT